jgi:hypothetical protein
MIKLADSHIPVRHFFVLNTVSIAPHKKEGPRHPGSGPVHVARTVKLLCNLRNTLQ